MQAAGRLASLTAPALKEKKKKNPQNNGILLRDR